MDVRERVVFLDAQASYDGELLEDEIQFLFETLKGSDEIAAVNSAFILGRLSKDTILGLTQVFSDLPWSRQQILVPIFAGAEFYEPYDFLLLQLKSCHDALADLIIRVLLLTEYFIAPLMLLYLSDSTYIFHRRMKDLFFRMGFNRLKPFLSAFPELPQETELREIFGDEKIDSLRES